MIIINYDRNFLSYQVQQVVLYSTKICNIIDSKIVYTKPLNKRLCSVIELSVDRTACIILFCGNISVYIDKFEI